MRSRRSIVKAALACAVAIVFLAQTRNFYADSTLSSHASAAQHFLSSGRMPSFLGGSDSRLEVDEAWSPEWDREVLDDAKDGRVLITGGGGNIGKEMTRRFLMAGLSVTVLDAIFIPQELAAIRRELPEASFRLTVHIGDIRNETLLDEAMTADTIGVVHLAAVSRVLWCLENAKDCVDINERGTDMVLQAVGRFQSRHPSAAHTPFYVLASSREVYGVADVMPVTEDAPTNPANIYGETKLMSEMVTRRHVDEAEQEGRPLHTIALRLSNVYGGVYDHKERLIPSLMTSALSHQVIQVVGGGQDLDMLHIDDCVDAFLKAVGYLRRLQTSTGWFASTTSFEPFNVVSGGDSVPLIQALRKILHMTSSKSPLQTLPRDGRFPDNYSGSGAKAAKWLGHVSRRDFDQGIRLLAQKFLQQSADYLQERVDQCGLASQKRYSNADLLKLDGCEGYPAIKMQGTDQLGTMRYIEGKWLVEDVMYSDLFSFTVREGADGTTVRFKSRAGKWLAAEKTESGEVVLGHVDDRSGHGLDWKVEVRAIDGTVRLTDPTYGLQWTTPAEYLGGISFTADGGFDTRMVPLCCPTQAPVPFYADDPIRSSIDDYRSEYTRPFQGSHPKTMCKVYGDALDRTERLLTRLDADLDAAEPIPLAAIPQGSVAQWVGTKDDTSCYTDCSHPTLCLDTGSCSCSLAACPTLERYPFRAYAHGEHLSFPGARASNEEFDLVTAVAKVNRLTVLQGAAARYLALKPRLPPSNVSILPEIDQKWRLEYADRMEHLREANCFTADTSLEMPLIERAVPVDDAIVVFSPYYQAFGGGRGYPDWLQQTFSSLPPKSEAAVVIPFTHDWGACNSWHWNVWEMRESNASMGPEMRDAIAWSVMGDLDSACYRPHQDIVIPSRTCVTPALLEAFSDLGQVKPVRKRRTLSTFSGSMDKRTGRNIRIKATCKQRPFDRDAQYKLEGGQDLQVLWGTKGNYDGYMELLGDTIFCPQLKGTTGWATRIIDVIYAGCIPVFFGDRSHLPFWDMINWSKVSITLDESDLDQLEAKLLDYTWEQLEEIQVNMMLMRDAMVYPLDHNHMDQYDENKYTPLFLALHNTALRQYSRFPTAVPNPI